MLEGLTFGVRYPDGDVIASVGTGVDQVIFDIKIDQIAATFNPALFTGGVPVVRVGTTPEDYSWETLEDGLSADEFAQWQDAAREAGLYV